MSLNKNLCDVTVVIPTYNAAQTLERAITSISEQTLLPKCVILIDDNSTDKTGSILKRWTNRNSKVVVVNNPKSGLVEALNFGLSQASNEWVARFDADDRYPFSRISETKKHINQDAIAIFSDYQFTSSKGIPLGYMPSAIGTDKTNLSLVTRLLAFNPSAP
jgi:glycosyltransferase involved in cell wall biosynthesis